MIFSQRTPILACITAFALGFALLLTQLPVSAAPEDLIITEIMYNTASEEGDTNYYEWVEIYNAGATAVSLAGFVLDDDDGDVLTATNITTGSIAPGGIAILYNGALTATDFTTAWAGTTFDAIPVSNWSSLKNSDDQVGLWSSLATYATRTFTTAVDVVDYADDPPWPVDDGQGSIFVADTTASNDLPANWLLSTPSVTGVITNANGDVGSPGTLTLVSVAETPPEVVDSSPSMGSGSVATDTDISLDFSEPVTVSADTLTLACTKSGSHASTAATSTGLDIDFIIADPLQAEEACTVTVVASEVSDADGLSLSADYTFTFTTIPEPTPPGSVFISEIMYDADALDDDQWEWVELYNQSSSDIDLTGYVIDDGNKNAHSAANITGTIRAQSAAILYNADALTDTATFLAEWPASTALVPVTGFDLMGLGNGGDQVAIWADFASYEGDHNIQANAIDIVNYEVDGFPEASGSSIYLVDLTSDNDNGANWAISEVGLDLAYASTSGEIGSPGLVVQEPTAVSVAQQTTNTPAIAPFVALTFALLLGVTAVACRPTVAAR